MPEHIDIIKSVEPIIRHAGSILLSYYQQPCSKSLKADSSIVTQADLESEAYLIKQLAQILPEASFFAEESGKSGDNDYCWVIDPLDGTTNFFQGLHHFCISVALTHNGTPIFGMVYQPLKDELFYAQQGKGAFLNGKKISMPTPENNKGIFVVGVPFMKEPYIGQFVKDMQCVSTQAHTLRIFGAIALDQAYVACGRIHGVVFRRFGWWDIAAGMLLIKEAGGIVTDFSGNEVTAGYTSFVGAHGLIHENVLSALKVGGCI